MRTQQEIDREIAALERNRARLPERDFFGGNNYEKTDAMLRVLREKMSTEEVNAEWYADESAEDYNENDNDTWRAADQAREWLEGSSDEPLADEQDYEPAKAVKAKAKRSKRPKRRSQSEGETQGNAKLGASLSLANMKLTEEQYLFVKLAEESVEVAQRITKALTFGLEESQPAETGGDGVTDNRERISQELDDLIGVCLMLREKGFIRTNNNDAIAAKRIKVEKFMVYSREQGVLT